MPCLFPTNEIPSLQITRTGGRPHLPYSPATAVTTEPATTELIPSQSSRRARDLTLKDILRVPVVRMKTRVHIFSLNVSAVAVASTNARSTKTGPAMRRAELQRKVGTQ